MKQQKSCECVFTTSWLNPRHVARKHSPGFLAIRLGTCTWVVVNGSMSRSHMSLLVQESWLQNAFSIMSLFHGQKQRILRLWNYKMKTEWVPGPCSEKSHTKEPADLCWTMMWERNKPWSPSVSEICWYWRIAWTNEILLCLLFCLFSSWKCI